MSAPMRIPTAGSEGLENQSVDMPDTDAGRFAQDNPELVPHWVKPGHRWERLHVPAKDSTEDDPVPLCTNLWTKDANHWATKPPGVYPPGYGAEVCAHCLVELDDSVDMPLRESEVKLPAGGGDS